MVILRLNSSFYGLLLLAISPIAVAEESRQQAEHDLTQIPIEQLVSMEVQSASKIASQISVAPSAVSIVTAADIKAYGYHTLAEILESMRGLYITDDRAYSFLGGRGFGSPGGYTGRIMLLLDGTQVNDNIYHSVGLDYWGIVDVALIERVEYVSGPGSTIYGNNAFFGIINVVTKKGHAINGLQVIGEAASYGGREVKVNYGKRLENGAEVLLSASGFNSQGQNHFYPQAVSGNSDGVARDLDGQQSQRLFGKLEWNNWFAELAYSNRKKDIPTAPYGTDFNAPHRYEDSSLLASLKHDRQLSPALQISLHTYYGKYHFDGLSTYDSTPWLEYSIGQWWGANAQFVGTWFQNQRILFGAEFRDDFQQKIVTPDANVNVTEQTFSLYAHDEITINAQWQVNLGARLDTNKNALGKVSNAISPRVALIYKPLDSTTLKLSQSTAYRRASPFEKWYEGGGLLTNPNIKPEHITATELVVEHRLDTNTRLQGSLYRYSTADYIKSVWVGDSQSRFINTNGGSSDGAELEFEKHWDNSTRLRTSVAIQGAEDGEGLWQINSPRQMGKINLSVPLMHQAWRAAFEMQTYSSRRTGHDTIMGGYSLANLTISAGKLLPNVSLAFGIRNLFDRDYASVAPPDNTLQTVIPQDGRRVWFRMTYDFK